MELCEKNIKWNNVKLREIRKKNNDSHQTSIITTNKKLLHKPSKRNVSHAIIEGNTNPIAKKLSRAVTNVFQF